MSLSSATCLLTQVVLPDAGNPTIINTYIVKETITDTLTFFFLLSHTILLIRYNILFFIKSHNSINSVKIIFIYSIFKICSIFTYFYTFSFITPSCLFSCSFFLSVHSFTLYPPFLTHSNSSSLHFFLSLPLPTHSNSSSSTLFYSSLPSSYNPKTFIPSYFHILFSLHLFQPFVRPFFVPSFSSCVFFTSQSSLSLAPRGPSTRFSFPTCWIRV